MSGVVPYKRPNDPKAKYAFLHNIHRILKGYELSLGSDAKSCIELIHTNWYDMLEAYYKMHERTHYCLIFQDMEKGMDQVRRAAVFCYWVLKLKPFYIEVVDINNLDVHDKPEIKYFTERFCFYYLNCIHVKFFRGKEIDITPRYKKELEYIMKYTDIGKTELTFIFEHLVDVNKIPK